MMQSASYTLGKSYLNRAFQGIYEIPPGDYEEKRQFKNTCTPIYNWAWERFNEQLSVPKSIQSYSRNRNGFELDIIYDSKEQFFCMRAVHPDQSLPLRQWTIEAEVSRNNEELTFGVKVSYTTPINEPNFMTGIFSMPLFVSSIQKKMGLCDINPLGNGPWKIQFDSQLEELYKLVVNNKRSMPVIVITEKETSGIGAQYMSGYPVNADHIANIVGNYCHVVVLPKDFEGKWGELVGKEWSVFNGAIRTYYPGLDLNRDDTAKHPLAIYNKIMASSYTDDNGQDLFMGDAFRFQLVAWIRNYNTRTVYDWKEYGFKFYAAASHERIKEQLDKKDLKELIALYEEDVLAAKEDAEEYNKLATSYANDLKESRLEVENQKYTIAWLRNRVDELTNQLRMSGQKDKEIDIPDTLDELPAWVKKHYPDKIVLLPRTRRSIKESEFEDIRLVYKAIQHLAEGYVSMKAGKLKREQFETLLRQDDLKLEPVGSIITQTTYKEDYSVSYLGRTRYLNLHLKKGNSYEGRYSLRIYFFWDEDYSQVVIGWLPGHLTNDDS